MLIGESDSTAGLGWEPISTAPTDGRHVQLYRPEIQVVGYYAEANRPKTARGEP